MHTLERFIDIRYSSSEVYIFLGVYTSLINAVLCTPSLLCPITSTPHIFRPRSARTASGMPVVQRSAHSMKKHTLTAIQVRSEVAIRAKKRG